MPTLNKCYPTYDATHELRNNDFEIGRSATTSDSVDDLSDVLTISLQPTYTHIRAFLEFDISGIPIGSTINSITIDINILLEDKDHVFYIVPLTNDLQYSSNDYSSYDITLQINHAIFTPISRGILTIPLNNYYPTPGVSTLFSIGILTESDYLGGDNTESSFLRISSSEDLDERSRPTLNILYDPPAASGYPHSISGVAPNSISSLSGILTANISSVGAAARR
jgi:hypothetical protein